jgi:hypothetical protein
MTVEIPRRPSTGAILLFLLAALALSALIFVGQYVAWFLEQNAIASESLAALGNAGKIWFIAQAVLLALLCSIASTISKSVFRRVYQSWLIASLITLPALSLRFLGPNNDQLGAFLQLFIGLIGGFALLSFRKRSFRFDRLTLTALALVPLAIWPFLLWGAFGSGTDIVLNLLAGLAFGLLTAGLVVTTESNYFLNGLGVGVLLAILGSAFGYDGGQLLFIIVLPAFGFALFNFVSSPAATTVGVGLLAAAPLVFIDPTELTIVLGDLFPWAMKASFLMMGLGLLLGLVVWLGSRWTNRPAFHPLLASVLTWGLAAVIYGFFGLHGFYGDRLFVILKDQADVSQAVDIKDRDQRLTFVYKTLTDHANATQADLRQTLNRFGIHYTPYYLVNAIEVDGSALVRLYLLNRPEVDRVIPSPRLRVIPQLSQPLLGESTSVQENPGWNIAMIGADKVWKEFGATGKGIVVGQSDSGVDGTHPALRDAYRGAAQGDDYNWYDPWTNSKSPNDQGGHGTHTLGIILGKNGIGIAPDAQWIGCVNLERNLGDPPLYLDCMQFMLAPFPQNGDPFKDGDPTRAAYVLNNSWGCPTLEGCDAESLRPAVDALRAAGIFVVASAGNDGPNCATLTNPPAIYDSAFSVGAVDQFGHMAFFSSRGPVTVDESNRVKPDISAPGMEVVSSLPRGTYGPESGTSMAGPHLVGVVALMWSANPDLIGNVYRTEQILIQTARPYTGAEPEGQCFTGGTPNNAYGYGIVDAYAAVKMALGK